jgi:ADP-heptose:LPS heptosyltransferase
MSTRDLPKRILVTRTDRIGDVILSLPVAVALKDSLPEVVVTFMVRAAAVPIVRMCPWVDNHVEVGEEADDPSLVDSLRQHRFDAAVCLFPRAKIASILRGAEIPIRVGTSRRFYSYRFNRRVNVSRRSGGRHESDLNVALVAGLGIEDRRRHDPTCIPPCEALASARILLGELGIEPGKTRFAVVHPGCGGSARNWTGEHYHQLCRLLFDHGLDVVVSGSSDEHLLAETVIGNLDGVVRSIVGKTDLPVLAAILKHAGVFVGPSTGPMHLAAAVGTPVVALFGPVRTTGPDRWGPLGSGHRVFVPPVETCNCRVDRCRLGDCMAGIEPAQVAQTAIAAVTRSEKEFGDVSQVFECDRD